MLTKTKVLDVGRSSRRALSMCLMAGAVASCHSSCKRATDPVTTRASSSAPAASSGELAMPVTLLQANKTAYHTRLDLTSDAIHLLTMDGAFRLVPDQPPQESRLDLSDTGVATPSSFIFWSNGSFWIAAKKGGPPGRLASVKERPIFIVSVDERFAWIGADAQGRHTVYTLRQGGPHALHVMPGKVAAATMVDDMVVFLERVDTERWRLGSVARTGGQANFTATRQGRHPAMLAAAGDVYYYYWDDKKTSEIRAVSPDLRSERVVASGITCSPLAVADRIFCVSMEGLFEVSLTSGLPQLVYPFDAASITTIAADRNRIVWVRDAGAEKLEVKLLYRKPSP